MFTKFSLFLIAASLAAAVNANATSNGCDTSFVDMLTQYELDMIQQDPYLYLDSTEWNERDDMIVIPPYESAISEGNLQYNYDFQFGGIYDNIPGKDRLIYKLPAKIKIGDFYTMGAHSSLPTDSVMRYMMQDIMTWLFNNGFRSGIVYVPSCWTKYNYETEYGKPDGESFDDYTFLNPPIPPDPTLYKWVPCDIDCCVLTFKLRNSLYTTPDGQPMTEAYDVTVTPSTIQCPDLPNDSCNIFACDFLQDDYGHFPRPTRVYTNDCWCGGIPGQPNSYVREDFSIDSSNYTVEWTPDYCGTPPYGTNYAIITDITSPDMSHDYPPFQVVQEAVKALINIQVDIGAFTDDTTIVRMRMPTCWREYESGFGLDACSDACCDVEYEIIKLAPDTYLKNTLSVTGSNDTCFVDCANLCDAFDLGQNFKRSIINVKVDKYESIVVPNPTSAMTEIMLKGNIDGQLKLEIINNLGRVVATFYTESKTFRFDSGAFASGVYHYRIRTDLEIISNGKFIIE